MKKLNKKTVEELSRVYGELEILQDHVEQAINEYNEAIGELNGVLENIAGDIQSYMDDRSEKWQESERAEQYQEWVYAFEVEKDEIDEPDFDHGELDELPVSVDDLSF